MRHRSKQFYEVALASSSRSLARETRAIYTAEKHAELLSSVNTALRVDVSEWRPT